MALNFQSFILRADVDGLRGVAIALVVGFHAFLNHVPGRFVGVDVFFVISGVSPEAPLKIKALQKRFPNLRT